ncbi:sodium-coupled monocarboxylate transporter 1 [Nephila pilipes]|uniref:Sodium-coupled monocarboxylate transporter 1 n=1 Tax=Nephila pilipes TaxID=299642 RepID=A0A8X6NND7_NEPPI|nr:sodium-coupled monocarboxylate transporter 1 [Nephila pilipes]
MVEIIKDVFGVVDYAVFALMLLFSASVGVWYAIVDRKKTDTQEFLMGGRSLSVFPVAMSVLASFMSAITLLGTPAEVYRFGTQYIIINFAFCLVVPATAYLYLPVFYNLGVTSAYEYLELRFHSSVRTIGAIVFTLHMLIHWHRYLDSRVINRICLHVLYKHRRNESSRVDRFLPGPDDVRLHHSHPGEGSH